MEPERENQKNHLNIERAHEVHHFVNDNQTKKIKEDHDKRSW